MTTQDSIGKLIDDTARRDAIHIAIAPAIASHHIVPGQHVGANGTRSEPHVGIVDPYLVDSISPGERFYIFLYPNTVTSLRHEWTHPAFDVEPQAPAKEPSAGKSESEKWLRAYAMRVNHYLGPDAAYERLMNDIRGMAIIYQGTDMHSFGELEDADELRRHASAVLGYEVDWSKFKYFSCTC